MRKFVELKQLRTACLVLFTLYVILFLFYLPGMNEGLLPIDDFELLKAPQLQCSLAGVKSIFVLGNHIDYYPVRDLTYVLDWCIGGDPSINAAVVRIQNWIWFGGSIAVFVAILFAMRVSVPQVFFFAAILMVHPLHSEMLMWPSARKDLLAIFFSLMSFFLGVISLRRKKLFGSYYLSLSIICFLLAIFSKASVALLPFCFLLWAGFDNRDLLKRRLVIFGTGFFVLMSLSCLIIQKYQYQDINSMAMSYSPLYRIGGVLVALGRYLIGSLWYQANYIDVMNWSPWVQINQDYLVVGVVGVVFAIIISGFSIYFHKKWHWILLLPAIAYGVNPGPNIFHRNFYSIRYFEVSFFLLFLLLAVFIKQTSRKRFFTMSVMILFFFLGQSYFEAQNWEVVSDAARKSYKQSLSNPANGYFYLITLLEEKRWGRLSLEGQGDIKGIVGELIEECKCSKKDEYVNANGNLCAKFWADANQISLRVPGQISSSDLICYDRAYKLANTPVARESIANQDLFQNPNVIALERFQKSDKLPTPRLRFFRVAEKCLKDELVAAKALQNEYKKQMLWSDTIANEELSLLSQEQRRAILACLK